MILDVLHLILTPFFKRVGKPGDLITDGVWIYIRYKTQLGLLKEPMLINPPYIFHRKPLNLYTDMFREMSPLTRLQNKIKELI